MPQLRPGHRPENFFLNSSRGTEWLTVYLKKNSQGKWLRGPDLNRRPSGYEPDELPGCSTPRPKTWQILRQNCNKCKNCWDLVPRTGLEPVSPIGHYHLKVACLPIPPPRHFAYGYQICRTEAYCLLLRDIAGWPGRCRWRCLLRFRWLTQIIPLTSFTGFVAVDITQHQTDDEEQRR